MVTLNISIFASVLQIHRKHASELSADSVSFFVTFIPTFRDFPPIFNFPNCSLDYFFHFPPFFPEYFLIFSPAFFLPLNLTLFSLLSCILFSGFFLVLFTSTVLWRFSSPLSQFFFSTLKYPYLGIPFVTKGALK